MLYGVIFSLRSVLSPLYACGTFFIMCGACCIIEGAFFVIYRVYCILRGNVSLYEVLISLYMADNSLYAVLSSRKAFFPIYAVLFLIVCGS